MNITRALVGSLMTIALAVGCGGDSGGSSSSSPLAKCSSNGSSSVSSACISCEQSKCSTEQKKCFGDNYNGGVCASFISCAANASDCHAIFTSCTPSADCTSCEQEYASCSEQNCSTECKASTGGTGGSGNGGSGNGGSGNGGAGTSAMTCSDLSACCDKISDANEKSGCQMVVSGGNDGICGVAYNGFELLCK